jgi:hypothetical protein
LSCPVAEKGRGTTGKTWASPIYAIICIYIIIIVYSYIILYYINYIICVFGATHILQKRMWFVALIEFWGPQVWSFCHGGNTALDLEKEAMLPGFKVVPVVTSTIP